jgi:CheY-like chemotaxis protein
MNSTKIKSKSLQIFLVENHSDTRKYYELFLGAIGHKVRHASTMEQALAAIPAAQCDVLISDLGLPDGTGWDLLEKMRSQGVDYPRYAIAVSGYGSTEDRERSRAAGFRHHLLKPFDPGDLERMLEEAAQELP